MILCLPSMALAPTTMVLLAAAKTLSSPRPRPRHHHHLPGLSDLLYPQQQQHHRGSSGGGARNADLRCRRRLLTARGERPDDDQEDDDEEEASAGFDAAVALFNGGEYHACHDVVEELWYAAEDPARTLLHAILQCAVGFHHLFNQNHRGAMMELGEGLCKLRKLNLDDGGDDPFARFRDEVAAVLRFLYSTQKELAACTDDLCLTMDGSASSYRLLGNFAAGQQLYHRFQAADDATEDGGASSIIFSVPDNRSSQAAPAPHSHRVKLPTLHATEQNLAQLQSSYQYM